MTDISASLESADSDSTQYSDSGSSEYLEGGYFARDSIYDMEKPIEKTKDRIYKYFPILLMIIGYESLSHRRKHWHGNIHTILLGITIMIPSVLSSISFITGDNILSVSYILFNLMMPVQYCLGIRYTRTDHFKTIVDDCSRSNISIPTSFKIFLFIIGSTIITVTTLIVIWSLGYLPNNHKYLFDLTNNKHATNFITALMIFNWIQSNISLSTNLAIFWVVFRKHTKDTQILLEKIRKSSWEMTFNQMNTTAQEIIIIRYVINQSVDYLEGFYVYMTVLGAIAIGPIIDFHIIDPFLFYYIIIYAFCQILFIYFMRMLEHGREDILKEIEAPTFSLKYLTNVQGVRDYKLLKREIDQIKDVDPRVATIGRWHAASEIHERPTRGRKIVNNQIDKMNERKIAAYNHVNDEHDQLLVDLMTNTYKLRAMQSWNVLKDELRHEWAKFNLLGIPFNGSEAIKKGLTVVAGIIALTSVISKFTFTSPESEI